MKTNQFEKISIGLIFTVLCTISMSGSASAQSTKTEPERNSSRKNPEKKESSPMVNNKVSKAEQELLDLSKQKWQWMAERKVDSLNALFDEKAVFVHMGGTMTKTQELEIIKSGGIQYKNAEIQESSVQIIDKTVVLLNKIRLTAVVGGNEVINPFVVTEIYVRQNDSWKLVSLSFTRLLGQ